MGKPRKYEKMLEDWKGRGNVKKKKTEARKQV